MIFYFREFTPLLNVCARRLVLGSWVLASVLLASCDFGSDIPVEEAVVRSQGDQVAEALAESGRAAVAAKVADGLELSLWATDSLAPDPVAMDIDDRGRVYLTRTNRQKNSEFDIRGHRDWIERSISLQSVEDRRAFLRSEFAPERSEENSWLKDLNNDTIHDWRDLTVEQEEIWRLEDTTGNGTADISTRILHDFNEEVTDVAGALLVDGKEVYVGVAPDMWRLTDENGDEVLDTRESLAHGFQVHIGFGGHGMSGAVIGPDGKLYWGIGDIGASITAKDGSKHHYPNQGVIVRCNKDGSDFEVFARGLRNTHEFVFDAYGNLITSDNDGDHQGESERLVYLVEGSDSGWRTNWQFGKYTDPKNNSYKVWMDEKLYLPRWEGQAAYILPPIQNFHNGPTGMQFNPGTALGSKWRDKFFLVEFIGDPARSHIWAFDLEPDGAGFRLKSEQDVLSGILPTGIRFGPDGALYLADWINGWNTKDAGRVWKLDVKASENDLEAQRAETEKLMVMDYPEASEDSLSVLLGHADMRIRKKAQFELADRGRRGFRILRDALADSTNQFRRIHAIWGLGQLAARDDDRAEPLLRLLGDPDPEITAQAAKVLGDIRFEDAGDVLVPLLQDSVPRVRFFAAQALGRIGHEPAVEPLLEFLADNDDQDVYLRHAGVLALSRIGQAEPLLELAANEDPTLRLAAVLVLRRMQHPGIARFLEDTDEYILAEAARAIHDDWSIEEALPDLAALLDREGLQSEPLLRRAISAAQRTGDTTDLDRLIRFARREGIAPVLRGEALAAVGTWSHPSVLDRVDGRLRGEVRRDSLLVISRIEKELPTFLAENDPQLLVGVTQVLSNLGITSYNQRLKTLYDRHGNPGVRAAVLQALGTVGDPEMGAYLKKGMRDAEAGVRTTAIGLLPLLDLPRNELPDIVWPIFRSGTIREQQTILGSLAEMPIGKSGPVLENLVAQAAADRLDAGVILDLIEAVESTGSKPLIASLEKLKRQGYSSDAFRATLEGGSWWAGRTVFTSNPAAQCVRCHAVDGAGGQVGPPLDNIGSILTREEILESLVEPGKRIAPGYGSVSLTLTDGQNITGLLLEEHSDHLLLRGAEPEPIEIPLARISRRTNLPSSMPPMGRVISKRELRDLIEYLSSLKENRSGT